MFASDPRQEPQMFNRRPLFTVQFAIVNEDTGYHCWATHPYSFASKAASILAERLHGGCYDGSRLLTDGAVVPCNFSSKEHVDLDLDFPF